MKTVLPTLALAILPALGMAQVQIDIPAPSGLSQPGTEFEEDLEPGIVQVTRAAEMRTIEFEGVVFAPDGSPVSGAIVVSSAGGKALTGSDGSFELQVRVATRAESVQVTAVGGSTGSLAASRQVSLMSSTGHVQVGSLNLSASAACSPAWLPTFGGYPGPTLTVDALTVFDDGGGAALYAGGYFWTAGSADANHIAKWDGTSWTALGSGLGETSERVRALACFDDGGGLALYAGGEFLAAGGVTVNRVAKWDGANWSALGSGMNDVVYSLTVYNDGIREELYAGGDFTSAGGVTAKRIAKWNGSSWRRLSAGIGPVGSTVRALAVFDQGSGQELFVGGDFSTAGSVTANSIARWDGMNWGALGTGVDGVVHALTVFDDGGGARLCVGGSFLTAGLGGAKRIAAWDGSGWDHFGSGMNDEVYSLTPFDDGSGPALYAGGRFTTAGGTPANYVAKWDGASWSSVGNELVEYGRALAVFDGGSGARLCSTSSLLNTHGVSIRGISEWNGSNWSTIGNGELGLNGHMYALQVFDDGNGADLYAGGSFTSTGSVQADNIAKWNGTSWTALGSGTNSRILALAVYDDGGGEALYAGGFFTTAGGVSAKGVAKWDGSSWTPLGTGTTGLPNALTVFDDGGGPALYMAGSFGSVGGVSVNSIAKWDGATWAALGTGLSGGHVTALTVFDDGNGDALYAGGLFSSAGPLAVSRIAKWDGSSWSALGSGIAGWGVFSLASFDDGGGAKLIVGGLFTSALGAPGDCVAQWDGSSWSTLGAGMNDTVMTLVVVDDGSGPALYAGGNFTSAGSVAANRVARWDGSSWSPLGSGVARHGVSAMTVFDDGGGQALHAGGGFLSAMDSGDSYLAKWGCPGGPSDYCDPAEANSVSASGAVLTSVANFGTAMATFDVTGVPDQPGLLFAGDGQVDLAFGCGRRCVGGSTLRGPVLLPVGNQVLGASFDMSPTAAVNIQYWYRDPAHAGVCGSAFNLSNAIRP